MSLITYDTKNDRRHVAVRFISKKDYDTKIRYWAWHHNYKGHNEKKVTKTSASTEKSGLSFIGIQAAVMDGSKVVKSCKSWAVGY